MSFLPNQIQKLIAKGFFFFHIVDETDNSQNAAGSSFKITMSDARQGVLNTTILTAFATGGQTNATVLTAYKNYFTTVASTDDSGKMPPAIVNLSMFVKNKGANSLRLFPNETENFDGLAADAHIDFPVGGTGIMFTCHTAGTWEVEI